MASSCAPRPHRRPSHVARSASASASASASGAMVLEAIPYEDIKLANGKVTRRCIANDACREKNVCFAKRVDMVDHLKDLHGIVHYIPFRKVGRPSGSVNPLTSRPSHFAKQSRTRFVDADYKFNRNKKKHEAKQKKAKLREWDAMTDEEKGAKGPRDVFLDNALMVEMEAYMSKKDERMREIQRRIVEGYDVHKRLPIERMQAQVLEVRKVDDERLPIERMQAQEVQVLKVSKVDDDVHSSPPQNLLARNEHVSLLAPTKQGKREKYCKETPFKNSPHSQNKERSLSSQILKAKKIRWSIKTPDVTISDSPALSLTIPFTSIISNEGIQFESSTNMDNVVEVARERFESGLSIHFKSQRSSLLSEVDVMVLDRIMIEKASTITMNLFMMWLENTLPRDVLDGVWFLDSLWYDFLSPCLHEDSTRVHNYFGNIDMAKHLFLFLPIAHRGHWVLFVLYNNHKKKLIRLPWENHGIMYFNSLPRSNPKHHLPVVQRALQIMSKNCSNLHLKSFMDQPRKALDPIEIPEVPCQPNAIDCGFYVMMFIKRLIDGAYGKRSKSWLTKTWFKQEDVLSLKEGLCSWGRNALGVENK